MTRVPSIAILGTDALLAALPATPVQLAHGCLALGYAAVFPVSWGDELVAAGCLRHLAHRADDPMRSSSPAIVCSCPHVASRLLSVGADLAPFIVPLVAPPVAAARLLRTLYGSTSVRITYVGGCPFESDPSIDARATPPELLAQLAERNIAPIDQPEVFEGVVPPDRSRFFSLPGGVPSPEMLWAEAGERVLVEIDSQDYSTELAQHLISGQRTLLDLAARLGCACSGAVHGGESRFVRDTVAAIEPPRSRSAVLPAGILVDVDFPLVEDTAAIRENASAPSEGWRASSSGSGELMPDAPRNSIAVRALQASAQAARREDKAPALDHATMQSAATATVAQVGPSERELRLEPEREPELDWERIEIDPAGAAGADATTDVVNDGFGPLDNDGFDEEVELKVGCTPDGPVRVPTEIALTDDHDEGPGRAWTARDGSDPLLARLTEPMSAPVSTPLSSQLEASVATVSPPEGALQSLSEITPSGARRRFVASTTSRAMAGAVPVTRTGAGRVLPRAYVARRRTPPEGVQAIRTPINALANASTSAPAVVLDEERRVAQVDEPKMERAQAEVPTTTAARRSLPRAVVVPIPSDVPRPIPPPPPTDYTRLVVAVVVLAVACVALVALVIRFALAEPATSRQGGGSPGSTALRAPDAVHLAVPRVAMPAEMPVAVSAATRVRVLAG